MDLNKLEIENIKTIIEKQSILQSKLINYFDFAVDPQIKQIFNEYSEKILKDKQNIIENLKEV